jgi:hypothetical protein
MSNSRDTPSELANLAEDLAREAGKVQVTRVVVLRNPASTNLDIYVHTPKMTYHILAPDEILNRTLSDLRRWLEGEAPHLFKQDVDTVKLRIDKLRQHFIEIEESIADQLDTLHEEINELTLDKDING